MFEPVFIQARNFMSYEDFELTFDQGQSQLIYGQNLDDDGADSNGAGKSAIIKAITVALLGIPDANLNKEDYIRDGNPRAIVRMRLENNVHKTSIEVERVVNRSSAMKVNLWVDDEEQDQLTSVAEADKQILQMLDITKEDLLNYYIINQDNSHSFFEATDTQQKKIVARFTNSGIIDVAIDNLKQDMQNLDTEIDDINTTITKAEAKIEQLEESIQYEKVHKESTQGERKAEIRLDIEQENEEIGRLSTNLKRYKKKLARIQGELEGAPLVKDDKKLQEKQEKAQKRHKKLKKDLREATEIRDEIDIQLSGTITCPNCEHEWVVKDEKVDVKELKKLLKAVKKTTIPEIKDQIQKIKEKVDGNEEKLEENRRNAKVQINLQSELEDMEKSITRTEKRIEASQKTVADWQVELSKIGKFSVDRARIDDLTVQIDSQKRIVDEAQEKLSKKTSMYDDLQFWEINLGIKGFKTYLVNMVLESLEGYVNYHLNQFRTNLKIKINGYRLTKEGKVSEKIDILVTSDGEEWKKYKRHSGGQRARINVCGILTIHKLINMSSKRGGINMLLLDEFFEGLDVSGQREIINILQDSRITNLVISHNNSDIGAVNQLWVRYKNSVSEIVGNKSPVN